MSYDDYDDAYERFLDDYVPREDVVEYVMDHHREEVRRDIADDRAQEWFEAERFWLDLLNIVSGYDREQLREGLRRGVGSGEPSDGALSPSEYFTIASQVSEFLESKRSPYAGRYGLSDDMTWVVQLIDVTRAFRDVLLALPESKDEAPADAQKPAPPSMGALVDRGRGALERVLESSRKTLEDSRRLIEHLTESEEALRAEQRAGSAIVKPLEKLNATVGEGVVFRTVVGVTDKKLRFSKKLNTEVTPLRAAFANWMIEYLTEHIDFIKLAPCIECGRIFERARKDNVYCSKTCQNRVAYKRKKIFEAGVLRQVDLDPVQFATDASARTPLRPGLWVYHARLGLGEIEDIRYDRRISVEWIGGTAAVLETAEPLPSTVSAEELVEQFKAKRQRDVSKWTELVNPARSKVTVRFLPTVRVFPLTELLNKEGGLTLYEVEDRTRLSALL